MLLVPLQGKKTITGTFLGYFPKGLNFCLLQPLLLINFAFASPAISRQACFSSYLPTTNHLPRSVYFLLCLLSLQSQLQLQCSFIHVSVPTCGEGDATSLMFIYKLQACVNLAGCTQQKGAFQNWPSGTANQTALAQFPWAKQIQIVTVTESITSAVAARTPPN